LCIHLYVNAKPHTWTQNLVNEGEACDKAVEAVLTNDDARGPVPLIGPPNYGRVDLIRPPDYGIVDLMRHPN